MKEKSVSPKDIKNIGLKRDLKLILNNPQNVIKIFKGNGKVTDFSIEIWFKEPASFSSYVYYENEEKRETDFNNLQLLIEQWQSTEQIGV